MQNPSEDIIIQNIEEAILGREDNPLRFERFCIDIYRESQGVPTVPTSYTWDQGRDGKSLSDRPHIICVSLRADVEAKSLEDITRLKKTTKSIDTVAFFSSQPLTEHACDLIAASIRETANTEAVVLGRGQIAHLARTHPGVFSTHYHSEITQIKSALLTPNYSSDAAQANALRLALCTHGHESSHELREAVLSTAILEVLQQAGPLTENDLARRISESLRLPKPLKQKTTLRVISSLIDRQKVTSTNSKYSITPLGTSSLTEDNDAVETLLEGKSAVLKSIEDNLGYKPEQAEYNEIWQKIQDSLADIFYNNGLSIVSGISALLEDNTLTPQSPDVRDLASRVDELATRATRQILPLDRQREIQQAISDTFLERETAAFSWLSQVAATFLCIASLGLEGTSAEALKNCINRTILVFDSDILISFLCEAEPAHKEAREVVHEWRAIGGQVATSPTVMEEVAHHAWISEKDFSETYSLRGALTNKEDWLFANAFVRTYWHKARRFSPREWVEYIREFRGSTSHDFSKIQDIMIKDHHFTIMQEVSDEAPVAVLIKNHLINLQKDLDRPKEYHEDKSKKDGRLLASIHNWRQQLTQSHSEHVACVVSSSVLLQKAATAFRSTLGEPEAVMPLAAAAYLLSLLPNVKLPLTALRSLLFSAHRRRFIANTQRIALRALAASHQYTLPFSRRGTLQNKLNEALRRESRARGVSFSQQEKDFIEGRDPESTARVVASALDALAVNSRIETENEILRRQLREANEKLRQATSPRKKN